MKPWDKEIQSYDDRRDIMVLPDSEALILFSAEHFTTVAQEAIQKHGGFSVALSGGSTPKAIFEKVTASPFRERIDWSKVWLFWSDERAVAPDQPESNYRMAMDAGFSRVPIPPAQIFRMPAEREDIEQAAREYETVLTEKLPRGAFDLMMLGMGEDGHTASLFPMTHGLHAEGRLAIANFIPEKGIWRMTVTFECINHSLAIAIYVMSKSKSTMLKRALNEPHDPDHIPIQRVGTRKHKALWIVDRAAAAGLMNGE